VVEEAPFGRYRLIELLGRGGMGEVWRAHDTHTDRIVAIKRLPAHYSDNAEFQRRFRREAHAAARLNTPQVVPIHNYGEIDGRLYVDMRLIEGRDLQTVLAEGPLDPARAVRIIEQVAKALHAAHEVGLLHRDVKPSNILLDRDDFAYLMDFGIARAADEMRLTKAGNTIGTFQHIAPEWLGTGAEEHARADIYSLACVLYECLTGHPPFAGDTMAGLIAAHLSTPPPRPSSTNPNVPAAFDPVIATGMAKDPDERYATTVELADAAHDAITTPLARSSEPTLLAEAPRPAPARFHDQVPPPPAPAPQPVWQQAAEPTQPATPPPRGQRPCRPLKWPLIAAIVVILAAAGITGYLLGLPRSCGLNCVVLPFTGLNRPVGVAVDSAGDLYVVDLLNNRVVELAAGSSAQTVLPFTGLDGPWGVAVDSAGNLYVTDGGNGNNRVLKLAAGSSTQSVLPFTGLNMPFGVAVDTAGNLYVADFGGNRVLKLAAAPATQTVLPFTGLKNPEGVAVDAAGNVYVTDGGNNRVLKLAAGSSTQSVLPLTGLNAPYGVAVDTAGNLYVASCCVGGLPHVAKLAAGSSTQTVLPFTGLSGPFGVAVDAAGNLYVADPFLNEVLKLSAG
jgi:serine/threonine protein kinase, bacterial